MTIRYATVAVVAASLTLWATPLVFHPAATEPAPVYQPHGGTIYGSLSDSGASGAEFLGTVLGTVTDATGDPVEGVAVFVRPLALTLPPVVGAFITDAWGRFRVTGLAAGRYSFVAIHGFYPPGAVAAVPVFPDEPATEPPVSATTEPTTEPPTSATIEPPAALPTIGSRQPLGPSGPCFATRPIPGSREGENGVYWRTGGCVEVDIVLDLDNLLDA